MKRSNVLVTVGDGIDPRSEEQKAQSKAVAEAGRAANAEEVYTPKQSGKSTAVARFWRTDQQDRDGKPKLLQQVPIFAKKVGPSLRQHNPSHADHSRSDAVWLLLSTRRKR
jgi:hypothetical protein